MSKYAEFKINTQQAKQIANAIVFDIADYIKNHQEEYQVFLKNEGGKM